MKDHLTLVGGFLSFSSVTSHEASFTWQPFASELFWRLVGLSLPRSHLSLVKFGSEIWKPWLSLDHTSSILQKRLWYSHQLG